MQGGCGSAILEFLEENDCLDKIKVKRIGLPDMFIEHGNVNKLREKYGIDKSSIKEKILAFLRR